MDAFSHHVEALRPRLLQAAKHRFGMQSDADAEDLLGQAIVDACCALDRYDPDQCKLYTWLYRLMRNAYLDEKRRLLCRVQQAPLEDAAQVIDTRIPARDPAQGLVSILPEWLQDVVRAWIAGYSQVDIAREFHLHRKTVAYRLSLAFELIQREIPDAAQIDWYLSEFYNCAQVPVYHKPTGQTRRWMQHHPPDGLAQARARLSAQQKARKARPPSGKRSGKPAHA